MDEFSVSNFNVLITPGERIVPSGGPNGGQETIHLGSQLLGLTSKLGRRAYDLSSRSARLGGLALHERNVARHILRARGGFLSVARDLTCRRRLLLDCGVDRS